MRLCSTATLGRVLDRDQIPGNWQIQKLPPPLQIADDNLFRCIVLTGEYRSRPLKMKVPS